MKYKRVPNSNMEIADFLDLSVVHPKDPVKLARNIQWLRRFRIVHKLGGSK